VRLLLRLFLVLLLLLLIAGGAAYLWRRDLVAYVLDDQLATLNAGEIAYEIEEVTLRGVALTGIAWGPAGTTTARRLEVTFDPFDLIAGKVEQVTLEGLRVTLDLTGAGPVLPGLPEGLGSGGEAAGDGGAGFGNLPPIALRDVVVVAETLVGPSEARLEGDILPDGLGGIAGVFALELKGDLGRLAGSLSLTRSPAGEVAGAAVLEDGRLDLPGGSIGGLRGELDFLVGGEAPPRLHGDFSLSGIEVPQNLFDTADLKLVLENGRFDLDGRLSSPDRKAEAVVKATVERLLQEPEASLRASVKLQSGSALWPLLGLADPTAGALHLRFGGRGTLPALDRLSAEHGGLLGWLAGGDTRGRLEVDFLDLFYPQHLAGLAGQVTVDWGLLRGVIVAGLPQDAILSVQRLSRSWLEQDLGIPSDTAALLAEGVRLQLPSQAAANPKLHLQPSATGHLLDLAGTLVLTTATQARVATAGILTLDLTPRLEVVGVSLQGLALQAQDLPVDGHVIGALKIGGKLDGTLQQLAGPLGIDLRFAATDIADYPVANLAVTGNFESLVTPASVKLTLQSPGTAAMEQMVLDGDPMLAKPVDAGLEEGWVALDWSSGDLILTHDAVLKMGEQELVFGSGSKAVPLKGDFGRARLTGATNAEFDYAGTAGVTEADLKMPSYGLTLGSTTLAYIFPFPGETAPPGRITVERGAVDTGLGRVSGLTVEADVIEGPTTIQLVGGGRGPGGVGRYTLQLDDDSATDKGRLTVNWGPVAFKQGGLQPGTLMAWFKDFTKVSGTLKLALRFDWSATDSSSRATVTLTDVAFTHPQFDVAGLTTTVSLNRLSQLSTPPDQKISADLLNLGVPLQGFTATAQIKPGRDPTYLLSDVAFTLYGGRFTLPAITLGPAETEVSGTVSIQGLDLAVLTGELAVSEFAMEGKMSGSLPFAYWPADETVLVNGGRLVNDGPGVIHYGKPGTASLRAAGDENYELALQALENFQFKTLDLTIHKAADGKAQLLGVLEGNNPEVLDGYPFRININLQTNLAQVLSAIREGYRLNPDLFKGGWTFN